MILGKKVIEHEMCFYFFLQVLSETFPILTRIRQHIIVNVDRSSCEVPLFLSDFNENRILNFVDRFSKDTRILNFMKIRPVGTEFFNMDRRTDKETL
jgi:hypothetical protein